MKLPRGISSGALQPGIRTLITVSLGQEVINPVIDEDYPVIQLKGGVNFKGGGKYFLVDDMLPYGFSAQGHGGHEFRQRERALFELPSYIHKN